MENAVVHELFWLENEHYKKSLKVEFFETKWETF